MPICYHVKRKGNPWKPGQVLRKPIREPKFENGDVLALARHALFQQMFPTGVSSQGWLYLVQANPKSDRLSGVIEVLAEHIRRLRYQDRLSRWEAFFAFESVDDASSFIRRYPAKGPQDEAIHGGEIWEVEAERVAHRGDMNLLDVGRSWLDTCAYLHFYWQGLATANPVWEVLLPFPIRVVSLIRRISDPEDRIEG